MSTPFTPEQEQLRKIFYPYTAQCQDEVRSKGTRFVHYTSADTTSAEASGGSCQGPNEIIAYLSDQEFPGEFEKVVNNIETQIDFLKRQDRKLINDYLFGMLAFAVVSTKNPAFAEELEWRIIHVPGGEARFM